jgi:hypothetical protein
VSLRHADDCDLFDRAAADRDQRIARLRARIAGLRTAADLLPASESGNKPAQATRTRGRPGPRQPFPQPPTANQQTDNQQPTTDNRQPSTIAEDPARARKPPAHRQRFSPCALGRRHDLPVAGVRYRPRKPENSVLRKIVRENLHAFLDQAEQASGGHRFPRFVIDELQDLLGCGDIRRGLALFRCSACNAARAVPLSCKSRALCPSCGARRMTLLSAHLVDNVIPWVAVRFWVMTFPGWLRRKIAYDHALYRAVIAIVDAHICSFYQEQAKGAGIDHGRTGSVHVEQLCGSALNLNHHDHAAYLDGVFYRPGDDPAARLEFRPARPPAENDIAFILSKIRYDVLVHLRDRGMLAHDPAAESLADEAPLLLACTDASIQSLLALGPRSGKGPVKLGADPHAKWSPAATHRPGTLHAHYDGFDLHAEQLIAADDREALERAFRYATRPPLSEQRLSILADGRVNLSLKKTWSDDHASYCTSLTGLLR